MSDDPRNPRDPGDEPSESQPGSAAPFDSGDSVSPEDDARWRRPRRQGSPQDRFPMLPEEAPPPTAPLKDPPKRRSTAPPALRSNNNGRNLVTLFFLLASCGVIAYVAVIWQNPYSTLNPLAPPTPLPIVITATYTPTATLTPSPIPSDTPTPTATEMPSQTPTATFTPIFLAGFSTQEGGTPQGTEDTSTYRFSVQRGKPLYITNPQARGGCNWSSIAGSVMQYDGSALNGYSVRVAGDDNFDQTVKTGSASSVGPGGFEIPLGTVARDAHYVAQLLDPQGVPVSPVYEVETRSDCTQNIAKLVFVEDLPSS